MIGQGTAKDYYSGQSSSNARSDPHYEQEKLVPWSKNSYL